MNAAVDDLKAEGVVGLLGDGVIDEGVGGHFAAAVAAGPGFGGSEEGAADAPAAEVRRNIPAFEVADGVGDVAAVSVRAEADFGESDELAVRGFGDEVDCREGGGSAAGEDGGEFLGVVGEGAVGPEGVEKRGEAVEVGGSGGADHGDRTGYRGQGTGWGDRGEARE